MRDGLASHIAGICQPFRHVSDIPAGTDPTTRLPQKVFDLFPKVLH